jgi:peroxiredoxin
MKRIKIAAPFLVMGIALTLIWNRSSGNPILEKAQAEKDPDRAISLYWQYFNSGDRDSSFASAADEFADLLAENRRLADLCRLGDKLAELLPPPASPLNTIAYGLAQGDTALAQALRFSQIAAAAQMENSKLPPPPDRSPKAWIERQNSRLAYYLDTEGFVLLRKGEAKKALDVLLKADSLLTDSDYEVYLHIGQAYWKLGDPTKALQWAVRARYFLGDRENPELARLIRDAYAQLSGSEEGLDVYLSNRLDDVKKEEYSRLVAQKLDIPAKEFALKDLQGEVVKLSDYRGKILLVDFWATWCGPCKRELPLLQAEYPAWKAKGIELLAISTDRDAEKVAPFIRENKYSFRVLFNDNTARDYDVSGIPCLYVIDPNGVIRYRHLGYRPDVVEILNLQIAALSNEESASQSRK